LKQSSQPTKKILSERDERWQHNSQSVKAVKAQSNTVNSKYTRGNWQRF
jgi:hypothetical protein